MFEHRYASMIIVLVCAALSVPALAASDYARERKWADEITPGLVVGDAVQIEDAQNKHRFLALLAPAEQPKAAVILAHGLGVHPDWGLIGDLRARLVDAGYTTLSVQMPVLSADAKAERYAATYPEAAARINAAIDYLRKQGYAKVAVVSHSMGSRMVNAWATQNPAAPIVAWVAIGMVGDFADLKGSRYPILDLYGQRDLPAVLSSAPQRAAILKHRAGSQQVSVPGSDHFFEGHDKPLLANVSGFLDRAVASPTANAPTRPAVHQPK